MTNDQLLVIKPKALKKNSLITLIAPAGPITESQLAKAQENISGMGFRTCFTNRIFEKTGYLAGSDETRIADLHEAFENKEVEAILCIRGGYGATRIVDKINYHTIRKNPKIFIGYSDITVLLNSIFQKTRMITFHGVVGSSVFSDYTRQLFTNILCNQLKDNIIYTENNKTVKIISSGKSTGQLTGGNLSIIASLTGTSFELEFDNKIVFFEDVNEPPYKIDRMLTQLLLSGKLQKASAIILGEFKGCDIDNKEITKENSLSLIEVFKDRLTCLGIPVIMGFSFGHVKNQALFPIGINACIDTNYPEIQLLGPIFT